MKSHLIFILLTCIFLSCSPNDVEISDNYKFDGMGGISCEVEGALLKPNFELYGNARARGDSYPDGTPIFSISFSNDLNPELEFQHIRILLIDADSRNDLTGQNFILKKEENGQSFGEYGSQQFGDGATNSNYTGEVKILYHNREERIIGGDFWFDAVNDSDEIREVRNGAFDMFYY
ncbi:hypothetical protein RM549_08885 [Salegentibacter sp. F188]|uniref:Uncharacterized protein n=1 Tax=Autumnicola patrickiae TaxID=3075591 RepID=A0ABU3E1M5_9FLAO|nr:hypothetical protein [Salegentibacter sp. F188]MDT0689899.1 hypothetical protein [Salegentibacter sp. F188]